MPYEDPDEVEILGALTAVVGEVDILGTEEMIGDIGDFFSSVGKAAGAIIKSPITKTIAGAAAIVFPPVGVPASAALVVADRAVRTAEGMRGTPKQQATVRKAVTQSVRAASFMSKLVARGKPVPQELKDAARAVEFMALAKKVRRGQAKIANQRPEALVAVDKRGKIKRGHFVQV